MKIRRIKGGFWAAIGYLLSPLSFWNDLYINIPIAYAFGLLFGLISEKFFLPAVITSYWLTNIAGFMLMHKGAIDAVSKEQKKYSKKEFIKDLLFSILYTLIIVALALLGWLKFPSEYFR